MHLLQAPLIAVLKLGSWPRSVKARVVASSIKFAAWLRRVIGPTAGDAAASASNLGVDTAMGLPRRAFQTQSVRRSRWQRFAARCVRLRRLRRAARHTSSNVFRAGLSLGLTYGAEVYGFSDNEVRAHARAAVAAQGFVFLGVPCAWQLYSRTT